MFLQQNHCGTQCYINTCGFIGKQVPSEKAVLNGNENDQIHTNIFKVVW